MLLQAVFRTLSRAKYLSLPSTSVHGASAGAGPLDHVVDRALVVGPLRPVAPVFVGQLPLLVLAPSRAP